MHQVTIGLMCSSCRQRGCSRQRQNSEEKIVACFCLLRSTRFYHWTNRLAAGRRCRLAISQMLYAFVSLVSLPLRLLPSR